MNTLESQPHFTADSAFSQLVPALYQAPWPSDDMLEKLPFGHDLAGLVDHDRDPKDNRDTPGHVRAVVKKALQINENGLGAVVPTDSDELLYEMAELECDYLAIYESPEMTAKGWSAEAAKGYIAVCALYHDIGKVIQRDRHPTIGYYHLQYSAEQPALRGMFRTELDYWLFLHIIRFHDVFGVVSTGEGSLSALVDLIPMREMSEAERLGILHLFLRINLADIAGTVPVRESKIRNMMSDLRRAAAAMPAGGKGTQPTEGLAFREALIAADISVGRAVARIGRMLAEPGLPEYQDVGLDIVIERELMAIQGSNVRQFANTFSHVCKLDYLLRFVRALQNNAKEQGKPVRTVVNAFVALLCRVVNEYGDLTYRLGGDRRRIGIALKGWTREPGTTTKLCNMLFDDTHLALQWATEEATAWFYD
ncbi:HD domain-containing protein [Rhodoferax sp.]|uniref:HD domain-containing protein n=1 Tax=Rhodoferax sp. TaxID=50421 RepID=UPI00262D63FD|nr:HD domain-containing protein [Rhodoferax sp.]MDD5478856.1 HD domain-containing protein [Rhodoferax sp.]